MIDELIKIFLILMKKMYLGDWLLFVLMVLYCIFVSFSWKLDFGVVFFVWEIVIGLELFVVVGVCYVIEVVWFILFV